MMSEKRFFVKVYSNNEPFFFDEKQEYVEERYTCGDVRNLHPMEYWQVVDLLNEQQTTIQSLKEENIKLKDYIDTIFDGNTHICNKLDVEDVQFYCDKNKNYRNPSCLYEKCFDEENLIKIKDEIRRVLE